MEQTCFYDQYYTQLCEALGIDFNKGKTVTVTMPVGTPIKVTYETKDTDCES